jgi:hypothetical protein
MATQIARHAQAFQKRLLAGMRASCLNSRLTLAPPFQIETRAEEAAVAEMRKWQIVKIATAKQAYCLHDLARVELEQCRAQSAARLKKTIEFADTLREIRVVQGLQVHSEMCLCKHDLELN